MSDLIRCAAACGRELPAEEVARRAVEHGLSTRDVEEEIELAARRQSEEQGREERRKNEAATRLATVTDLLAKKKADPAKVTLVGYTGTASEVLEQLKPLGWKVKVGDSSTPAKGICDCSALRLSFNYEWPGGKQVEKVSLAKACISSKHPAAARKADQEAYEEQERERKEAAVKAQAERDATLAPATTALTTPIPPTKAKLILMTLIAGEGGGNGWWTAGPWIERVTGKAASYDSWMVKLWQAIDGLDHGRLLTEIAHIVAKRIVDAGPDPAREALESLYGAGERVAAKRATRKAAKS